MNDLLLHFPIKRQIHLACVLRTAQVDERVLFRKLLQGEPQCAVFRRPPRYDACFDCWRRKLARKRVFPLRADLVADPRSRKTPDLHDLPGFGVIASAQSRLAEHLEARYLGRPCRQFEDVASAYSPSFEADIGKFFAAPAAFNLEDVSP